MKTVFEKSSTEVKGMSMPAPQVEKYRFADGVLRETLRLPELSEQ